MKKSLITGALIVVIGVSTFFAHKQAMKIADLRANEIYSETLAQAVKALPKTTVQRIVNTPEEKTLLNSLVKQEFKNDIYTEKTLSGQFVVTHEEKYSKEGKLIYKQGDNIYKLYLSTPTEVYKVENISSPVTQDLHGIKIILTGLLSSNKDVEGIKNFIVNIPEEKIRTLKQEPWMPVINWKDRQTDRGGSCGGNYCVFIVLANLGGESSGLPQPQDIKNYIFTNPGRIKDAFYEQSYGQMIYGGEITNQWITFPDFTSITPNSSNTTLATVLQNYVLENQINLSDYDQIMYLINDPNSNFGGASSVGPINITANGQVYALARNWVRMGAYYDTSLSKSAGHLTLWEHAYIHETGHGLGALHDNFFACQNGPTSLPSECIHKEYGNLYSTMGTGNYGSHFSFKQNLRIGWINEEQLQLGEHGVLELSPLELENSLFVKSSQENPEYVFEYRKSTGLDDIRFLIGKSRPEIDGFFVYRKHNSDYYLTDVSPAATSSLSSNNNVVLKNLQSFFDLNTGKQFTSFYNSNPGPYLTSSENIFGIKTISNGNPSCIMRPLNTIFAHHNMNANVASEKLPPHVWPQIQPFVPNLNNVSSFVIDNNDPESTFIFGLLFKYFNNDSAACEPTQIERKVYLDGELIHASVGTIPSWSGPHYSPQYPWFSISGYGLSYGFHTVTQTFNKLNDGSSVSNDFVFKLTPCPTCTIDPNLESL